MDPQQLRNILESCLLVAGKAMNIAQLESLFEEDIDRPERSEIKQALADLQNEYAGRGIELVEVGSGWRLQSSKSMEHWVGRLFQEKQPRYSRALLETLVLIAYRQPITRGEIEDVRGVAVSSNIIRTLQEREWIKEMGYKDVPGKPALWGTTKEFLDYFNLKRLDELPTLAEARDLAEIDAALAAEVGLVDGVADGVAANDAPVEDADGEANAMDGDEAAGPDEAEASEATEASTGEEGVEEVEAVSVAQGGVEEDIEADVDVGSELKAEADAGEIDPNNPTNDIENDDSGTELVNLAANLGKDRVPEPDLGALADHFDAQTDPQLAELSATSSSDASDIPADEDTTADVTAPIDMNNGESPLDDAFESQHDESPPVEAMEISAHDIDIEAWKEPASQRPVANEGDESGQPQAQSDLRRVIDDFAEEHRKQLDADSEHQANKLSKEDKASQSRVANSAGVVPQEPVTADGDDNGVLRTKLYGIHGAVESELDPATDSDLESENHPSVDSPEENKNTTSGEP